MIFKNVKEFSRNNMSVISDIVPGGTLKGKEYSAASTAGGKGNSFKYNIEKMIGSDFATDERFSDIIDLNAKIKGLSQYESAIQLRDKYLPQETKKVKYKLKASNTMPNMNHFKLGEPSDYWCYKDSDDKPILYVARYEDGDGKTFYPWTFVDGRWINKGAAKPRPLYNIPKILADKSKPVIVTEGEKAADAAKLLVGDEFVVTTWSCGSKATAHSDWSIISGRKVYLWADNDKPGKEAMGKIADILSDNNEVFILDVSEFEEKEDAADFKGNHDDVISFINNNSTLVSTEDSNIPLNDLFNANIFIDQNKDSLRFCNELGGWFTYNGKRWEKDKESRVLKLGVDVYNQIKNNTPEWVTTKRDIAQWTNHVRLSGNERMMRSFINLSKMSLSIDDNKFDPDNHLICLQNGVYDLNNFKLLDFSPEQYITQQANFSYDPEAKCPNWERLLEVIFLNDKELIKYMQKLMGYSLTGDISRQLFCILHGGGDNGKSSLLETMKFGMGDYATTIDSNSLIKNQNDHAIRNDIACLSKKRFVIASELDRSKELHISLVKKFTTLSPMKVRFLHKENFELFSTFKVFLETNPLPRIKGEDHGTWKRIRKIPFNHKFKSEDIVPGYAIKNLNPEINGIFNWLLAGLKELNEDGECVPKVVKASNDSYREQENEMKEFVSQYCDKQEKSYTLRSRFHRYYKERLAEHGQARFACGPSTVGECMDALGYPAVKLSSGEYKNQFVYQNLRCKSIPEIGKEFIKYTSDENKVQIPRCYSEIEPESDDVDSSTDFLPKEENPAEEQKTWDEEMESGENDEK